MKETYEELCARINQTLREADELLDSADELLDSIEERYHQEGVGGEDRLNKILQKMDELLELLEKQRNIEKIQEGSMNKYLYVTLREEDDAALITIDGEMHQGFVHEERDIRENADTLTELMVEMMKSPEAQEGIWLWKVTENWKELDGREI